MPDAFPFQILLDLVLYLLFYLGFVYCIYYRFHYFSTRSIEPKMWDKDQKFNSCFPLNFYLKIRFNFYYLRGNAINFTFLIFITFN